MSDRKEMTLQRRDMKESLSVLRIYLRRRRTVKQRGVRGWFSSKQLSIHLVEEALKIGITYGSVTMGHLGFVHGERYVQENGPDVPAQRLPTCVELVADRAVLDAFVDAFGHELHDAVLVRFDGAAVSLSSVALT
jgi:PII-like signaling protein